MSSTASTTYTGRFAPSPSGPLHLGSLYTALASFLHAKANQGQWLLRIDDLDTPRNVKSAADRIIETLHTYGLHWSGSIHYQSESLATYDVAIDQLTQQHLLYPCTCSRKTLSSFSIYPDTCRQSTNYQSLHSLRIQSNKPYLSFNDELQGHFRHAMAEQHGDFIIKRKDKIIAYQLAVVVDDYQQHITHVIRGYDLLDSTPKQIYLQKLLGYPTPSYCHVPIITDQNGHKLSKQNLAQAVDTNNPQKTLFLLLTLLKQNPPTQLKKASIIDLLDWAIEHWNPQLLNNIHAINPQPKG